MELVPGCSVQELINRAREKRRKVQIRLALRIFEQILEALAAAHEAGVIHRDVTPGNILLAGGDADELLRNPGRDPQVKLTDFGIAGLAGKAEQSQRSRVMGTTPYVAPEIHDPDGRVTSAAA
jgi:serine/threonine-protein kinase